MASGLIAILIFPQRCLFLEPGSWNLTPAMAPPSTHPFCRVCFRSQGSGVRMTLGPISLRPTMPARVWQGSCFLIPDS
jgi:hypothetical protein